jgi:hypothetical protein
MRRRKAIQATRTQMNTNVSLSQATKSLECVWDLERIWSLLLCLGVKSRALVLNMMAENLDALKCGGWGVFIAPTTKIAVGRGCCRWAHRTVRCATGHCPVRQPRHQPLGFDRWSCDRWDHRTVRWCTGQVLFTVRCAFWCLLWLCANCPCTVALSADRWTRPFHWWPLLRLAHRTVRCYTGQSGEL